MWCAIIRAVITRAQAAREGERARSLSTNQNAQTRQPSWNLFGAGYLLITLKKTKFDEHKMTKQVSRIYGQFKNERRRRRWLCRTPQRRKIMK